MVAHIDATIEANEQNAREKPVVAAAPGFYLLPDHDPILAWRIGEAECNCVLPVTCTGTHDSRVYVLCPDGRVRYNSLSYGSTMSDFPSIEDYYNTYKREKRYLVKGDFEVDSSRKRESETQH